MKNKIILVSATLGAFASANAAIELTENIALEGFVDMAYVHYDHDSDYGDDMDSGENGSYGDSWDSSDNSFDVDQVEFNFLFDFSPVTAQVDIQYAQTAQATSIDEEGELVFTEEDDIELEQAFATYDLGNGGAVTAGRYASMLGFEAFEPTGLYQYSFAYATEHLGDTSFLPGYNDGVKYTVETDGGFFGISLQDAAWNRDDRLGGPGASNWAVEAAAAWTGEEGLTLFLGGAYEDSDSDSGDSFDIWALNAYVSYEADAMTYAAELNYGEIDDVDALSGLIMANFAYSEEASVTGRISYIEYENDVMTIGEFVKFTAAHNYAFTDNLLLVAEISYVDGEEEGYDFDELFGAIELLFSF